MIYISVIKARRKTGPFLPFFSSKLLDNGDFHQSLRIFCFIPAVKVSSCFSPDCFPFYEVVVNHSD